LTPEQQTAVRQAACTNGFVTQTALGEWLQTQFGVTLTAKQVRRVVADLGLRWKIPRPVAAKADLAQQTVWKRGA
jgi:transposase